MLKTYNLNYAYDAANSFSFPDIQCGEGEKWLVLGQSGCGKTTLLHLLGGLLKPKQGDVIVGKTTINKLSNAELDKFRGKHIGIIFQRPHFIRALTVGENLQLAQKLAGIPQNKTRIETLLNRLNIRNKINSKPHNLSQGEQQRVSIARALVNGPDLILADEPTSALDDKNTHEVIKLLENQAEEENATLVIVTHDSRLKEYFKKQILL